VVAVACLEHVWTELFENFVQRDRKIFHGQETVRMQGSSHLFFIGKKIT